MKLSVIILNYNVKHFLQLCLQSVQAATKNLNAEVIVVDNNSKDGSCEMMRTSFPEITLIENKSNLGFSKANNQAVAIAKGEYVCILNPDTVVGEATFKDIIEFAESKENLGIIGCKLIDGKGNFLPESKRNLPIVKVALQKIRGDATNYYANHVEENDIAKVDILVGAFMLMKRQTFNELKGFDEDYFMYGEDIDISYKALKTGLDNYYFGKTAIIHYKGESTLKDRSYAKRFYGAMQIFYKKHFKSNLIFDTIVWLGIKLAFLIRTEQQQKKQSAETYLNFTNNSNGFFSKKISGNFQQISNLEEVKSNTTVVFDITKSSFKEIIDTFETFSDKDNVYFRILSPKGNFLIGSDCSFSRGEVIDFNKN